MSGIIALTNHSSLVNNADCATMAACIDTQLYWQVSPAHGLVPWRMQFYADPSKRPTGSFELALFDKSDAAGALGYHYVGPDGWPYGKVFIEPILRAGGGVLTGTDSVSATASHEGAEIVGDLYANLWADMPDGRKVAQELADPVEADSYLLRQSTSGLKCMVSNFVTKAWFEEGAPGPYDFLRRLTAPFEMSSGGYLIVEKKDVISNVWGATHADWRKVGKEHPASRTARRAARAALLAMEPLDPQILAALPEPEQPAA